LEKVVVLVSLSTAKLSLLFWIFLQFLIDFTSFSHNTQRRIESLCIWAPGNFKLFTKMPSVPPWSRRRWRARRRRGGARAGKQATGNCDWAHPRLIGGEGSAGEVVGERRRRRRGGAAAGARTEVRKGAMLNNALRRELPCGLGKMLGGSPGAEDRSEGRARQWRSGGSRGSSGSSE
jgi:hypothetical protein